MKIRMLVFTTLSLLVLADRGLANMPDVAMLLKKFPTWSFKIESVNSFVQSTKTLLERPEENYDEAAVQAKIDAILKPGMTHIVRKVDDPKYVKNPPSYFNAMEHWKECAELIGDVHDEGVCHTDGPTVIASVLTDRLCIYTKGAFKERLAAEWLAGCAEACTGQPEIPDSWEYVIKHGIPTGGPHGSKQGCLPYTDAPCKHTNDSYSNFDFLSTNDMKLCADLIAYDHDCPTKCSNKKYGIPLHDDIKKPTAWYYAASESEWAIRNEIMTYGPLAANMLLFSDLFERPANGMYIKADNATWLQNKSIKLIGWGEENNIKYWLALNTYTSWGNKLFKIPYRGTNYVDSERILTAAVFDDLD